MVSTDLLHVSLGLPDLRGIPTRKGNLPNSTMWSCRLQAGTQGSFVRAEGKGDPSVVKHPPTLPKAALSGPGRTVLNPPPKQG